jgi:hypothetical protein
MVASFRLACPGRLCLLLVPPRQLDLEDPLDLEDRQYPPVRLGQRDLARQSRPLHRVAPQDLAALLDPRNSPRASMRQGLQLPPLCAYAFPLWRTNETYYARIRTPVDSN